MILSEAIPELANAVDEGTEEVVGAVDGVGEAVTEGSGDIVSALEPIGTAVEQSNRLLQQLMDRLDSTQGRSARYPV